MGTSRPSTCGGSDGRYCHPRQFYSRSWLTNFPGPKRLCGATSTHRSRSRESPTSSTAPGSATRGSSLGWLRPRSFAWLASLPCNRNVPCRRPRCREYSPTERVSGPKTREERAASAGRCAASTRFAGWSKRTCWNPYNRSCSPRPKASSLRISRFYSVDSPPAVGALRHALPHAM